MFAQINKYTLAHFRHTTHTPLMICQSIVLLLTNKKIVLILSLIGFVPRPGPAQVVCSQVSQHTRLAHYVSINMGLPKLHSLYFYLSLTSSFSNIAPNKNTLHTYMYTPHLTHTHTHTQTHEGRIFARVFIYYFKMVRIQNGNISAVST